MNIQCHYDLVCVCVCVHSWRPEKISWFFFLFCFIMWSYTTFIRLYNSHEYSNGKTVVDVLLFWRPDDVFWLLIVYYTLRELLLLLLLVVDVLNVVWGGWFFRRGKTGRSVTNAAGTLIWHAMPDGWQCTSFIHPFRVKKRRENKGNEEFFGLVMMRAMIWLGGLHLFPATSGYQQNYQPFRGDYTQLPRPVRA